MELPKFFHGFHLLCLLFALIFSLKLGALTTGFVFLLVFDLDKPLTVNALFSASATYFDMVKKLFEGEHFAAKLAGLWTQLTPLFMCSELRGNFTVLAVLALNLFMRISLMVVFLSLSNYFATLLALVVLSCAPNFMHPKLAHVDQTLTRTTLLLFFLLFYHFKFG